MKVTITKKRIYLDSETEKETKSLEGFIFGDKKHRIPEARILFLNGMNLGSSGTSWGITIRKLSEGEMNLECALIVVESLGGLK